MLSFPRLPAHSPPAFLELLPQSDILPDGHSDRTRLTPYSCAQKPNTDCVTVSDSKETVRCSCRNPAGILLPWSSSLVGEFLWPVMLVRLVIPACALWKDKPAGAFRAEPPAWNHTAAQAPSSLALRLIQRTDPPRRSWDSSRCCTPAHGTHAGATPCHRRR